MKAHKEAASPNYALTMSRSFRSLSLLAPKRLKDRLDVTMHLQHDGNWKCSITGLPSWLIANRFLYTYCCLHFDSTLNGKFCEYSHGRCTFLKIENLIEFEMLNWRISLKLIKTDWLVLLTSTPRQARPACICCHHSRLSATYCERFVLASDESISCGCDIIHSHQHQIAQQSYQ